MSDTITSQSKRTLTIAILARGSVPFFHPPILLNQCYNYLVLSLFHVLELQFSTILKCYQYPKSVRAEGLWE